MAEMSVQQAKADEAEDAGGCVRGPRGVVLGLCGLMMEATFGHSNTGAKDEYGTLRTRPWHCTQTARSSKGKKGKSGSWGTLLTSALDLEMRRTRQAWTASDLLERKREKRGKSLEDRQIKQALG